jgi:hypothetical protein
LGSGDAGLKARSAWGRCSTAAQKRRRQVVHVARVVRAGREREMSCVGPER